MGKMKFGEEPKDPLAPAPKPATVQAPKMEPLLLAEHTVAPDETLSHVALKYYGSAVKDKWMVIYEANRELIGENPNILRPGLVLKIPKLPGA